MVFNSLTFIVFFSAVLFLYYLPFSWRTRKTVLLLASYLFYAAWNPPFVLLLWISTLTDWVAAGAIQRSGKATRRRFLLLASVCVNLGLLGFFKYGDFLLRNFIWLLAHFNIAFEPMSTDVVLPIGISFYTFQSLSYTIDVYRGRLKHWPSFLDFAMFVTFFPQLVAGPIVRAAEFLPQCRRPARPDPARTARGMTLLASGLFQKVILADALLAPVSDRVYGAAAKAGMGDSWIGTLAFSGQIFFDFNGYSTCAAGAALCLGFILPGNFRFPYGAVGFRDFWRRWHISLSSWLRDYLYIPMGGNRRGQARTLINIMLTMLIGGLWHGAAWSFAALGGLHGICLAGERSAAGLIGRRAVLQRTGFRLAMAFLTYGLICITWVFFRAGDFTAAYDLVTAMFSGGRSGLISFTDMVTVISINMALVLGHFALRDSSVESVTGKMSWPLRAAVITAVLITLCLAPGDDRAFIYFQF